MTMRNLFLGAQFYSCLAAGCFFFPHSAKGALPDADSHEAYSLTWRGKPVQMESAVISAMPFNRVWPGYQRNKNQTRAARFVNVCVDQCGELVIERKGSALPPHTLRPMSREPLNVVDGKIVAKIKSPEQFIVDFGQALPPLHVFANPPAERPDGGNVLYYGPGEHDVGVLSPKSGSTVFIDEGATVYGAIFVKDAHDVEIRGRGILDSSRMVRADPLAQKFRREMGLPEYDTEFACGAFTIYASTNVVVEGITIRDTPFWSLIVRNGCKNVLIDNVKVIGQWRYNSDGIDICASSDVVVRNCFVRSFDDCIVARGPYLEGEVTPVRNLLVENCVLWCDWGKNLEVWAGHLPCVIDGVVYRNNKLIGVSLIPCDVTCWYGSTNTVIRNVAMENLEIDLDKNRSCEVLQQTDDQVFVAKPITQQVLWEITLNRPCINLGNQQRGQVEDLTPYKAKVENVRFSNFNMFGETLPYVCRQRITAPGHEIKNVVVENVPPYSLEKQGLE